jgi:hypothetical protein
LVLLIALSMLKKSPALRAGRPADADAIDIFVSILVGFPALLSVIFGLVGQLRCCSVPAATGARLPAVLSVCFRVFALVFSGPLALEILLRDKRSAVPEWWLPAALAIGGGALLAEILYLVFFYSIGRSLREPAVINRVERLGIVFSFVTVFAVIGGIILAGDIAALFSSRAELASPSSLAFQSQQAMVQVSLAAGVFVQVALVGIALVLLFDLDLIRATRNTLASRFGDDKNERENKPVIEIPAPIETTAIPCAPTQTTESNITSETTGPPP